MLEMLKEERPVTQMAAENGIHPNQLYKWKTQVLEGLPSLFEENPKADKTLGAEHEREMYEQHWWQ